MSLKKAINYVEKNQNEKGVSKWRNHPQLWRIKTQM